ncbi:MAG: acyltransferase family protein [Hyphomicrobiaceae bacterium]|nr:acyltransferase family protein [Hyphomicrobiaceae bacterium]
MSQSFRGDIEGLRAVAVLPILLFHLDERLCPGGFVGVDVFFVISGYLITGMILARGQSFSLREFYLRRFMRLFPALLVTLLCTLIAGWWVLAPQDYVALAQSGIAALLGASNLYFYATIDYFNAEGLYHPLLHTWSLGLEEQFYLVWPLALLAALRWRTPVWMMALTLAALSFLGQVVVYRTDPPMAFYMMPLRMFEFALGASLIDMDRHVRKLPPVVVSLVGMLGIAMLAACLILFDAQMPWPGAASLLPCLATALLILAGRQGLWNRVLGHGALRVPGRISYSVYLVHWPLISLYRSHAITPPDPIELAALFVATLLLGAALYYAVETRFRMTGDIRVASRDTPAASASSQTGIKRRHLALVASTTIAFVAGCGAVLATSGFPARLDRAKVQHADTELTFAGDLCSIKRDRCVFGDRSSNRTVYLVGDSHALNLVHGLDALWRTRGVRGIALYDHGCLFLHGTSTFVNGAPDATCRQRVAHAFDHLAGSRDPVILVNSIATYRNLVADAHATAPRRDSEDAYYAWLRERFRKSLEHLNADGRTVLVLKQSYSTGIDLARCRAAAALAGDGSQRRRSCEPLPLARVQQMYARVDQMIDEVVAGFASASVLDPKPLFCDATTCQVQDSSGLYFRDQTHLTNAGSRFLIQRAEGILTGTLLGR